MIPILMIDGGGEGRVRLGHRQLVAVVHEMEVFAGPQVSNVDGRQAVEAGQVDVLLEQGLQGLKIRRVARRPTPPAERRGDWPART